MMPQASIRKLLTKINAAQNEVALSHHIVRGLYFLVVIFAANIIRLYQMSKRRMCIIHSTMLLMYNIHVTNTLFIT